MDRNQLWKQFCMTRGKKDYTYLHKEILLGNGKGYGVLGKEVNKHHGDKDKMPEEIIIKK